MMVKGIIWSCAVMFLALCCGGCESSPPQPAGYDFPSTRPIWIVEIDPDLTVFERKDLQRDRKVGRILVIPLYMDYQHEGITDALAIAHAFVCQPGEEIEKQLASFGQREKLRRLIVWAPGYLPDAIGRTFPFVPVIGGKRMIVLELEPCLRSEAGQLDAAIKSLLLDGDLVVEKMVAWKHRPPSSLKPVRVDEPYDFQRVVRSEIYEGRWFKYGSARSYVLWAFDPGARIANRLSSAEKKLVAEFVADLEKEQRKGPDGKNAAGQETRETRPQHDPR
jgi:hypothetical protein